MRNPNENKRDQSSLDSPGFTGSFRFRGSLITVWLEVRFLWSQRLCEKSPR